MTSAEAKTRVKLKFGIPTSITDFDTAIDEAVSIAVDLLAPYLKGVATVDTSQSLATGTHELSYTNEVSEIYYRATNSSTWLQHTNWVQRNGVIYFYEDVGAVSLKIIHYAEYTVITIASIARTATTCLVDFACSEFASMLAGNRVHFNTYSNTAGARAVDSMTDLANFYEGRALNRIERIADSNGVL